MEGGGGGCTPHCLGGEINIFILLITYHELYRKQVGMMFFMLL